MHCIIILFSFFLFPLLTEASPLVSGKVTDEKNGEPIPFAIIYTDSPAGKRIGTTSDNDGNFSLSLPEAGKYILVCRYFGYYAEYIPIVIHSEEHLAVTIRICLNEVKSTVTITLPPHHTIPADAKNDSVTVIEGDIPAIIIPDGNFVAFAPDSSARNLTVDSLYVHCIRHGSKDNNAAALLRNGRLVHFTDSTWYFINGSCPQYAFYYQHGDQLECAKGENPAVPEKFILCKTRKGYRIRSNTGVSAFVRTR